MQNQYCLSNNVKRDIYDRIDYSDEDTLKTLEQMKKTVDDAKNNSMCNSNNNQKDFSYIPYPSSYVSFVGSNGYSSVSSSNSCCSTQKVFTSSQSGWSP